MWDFFDVRKSAIEELSKVAMNPVTKVLLARECNIQEWLLAGYDELAKRKETISLDEAEQLGKDTAILLFQIREESLAKYHTTRVAGGGSLFRPTAGVTTMNTSPSFDRTGCKCVDGIQRAFAEELKAVLNMAVNDDNRHRVL
jgi:hypothetical protein